MSALTYIFPKKAIARAVYAKRELLLFDDVFSGLDMETQARIMRDVFGPRGLLKAQGTTAIFVTHASMYPSTIQGRTALAHESGRIVNPMTGHLLAHADFVVALDSSGCVIRQGLPDTLQKPGLDFPDETGNSDPSVGGTDHIDPSYGPAHTQLSTPQSSIGEEAQRLGDGAVYKYYFQTFGWQKTAIFFAFQVSFVFCLKFPGESDWSSLLFAIKQMLTLLRDYPLVVG